MVGDQAAVARFMTGEMPFVTEYIFKQTYRMIGMTTSCGIGFACLSMILLSKEYDAVRYVFNWNVSTRDGITGTIG